MTIENRLLVEALMHDVDLVEMVDLLHPPDWHRDAACKEHQEVEFFPGQGQSLEPARQVCRGCLVAAECLAWALEQEDDPQGVWAGTSARERRALRVTRGLQKAA